MRPLDGAVRPMDGAVRPMDGAVRPMDGAVRPMYGAVRPMDGAVRPMDGAVRPMDGAVRPMDGAVRPLDGAVRPMDGAVRPLKRCRHWMVQWWAWQACCVCGHSRAWRAAQRMHACYAWHAMRGMLCVRICCARMVCPCDAGRESGAGEHEGSPSLSLGVLRSLPGSAAPVSEHLLHVESGKHQGLAGTHGTHAVPITHGTHGTHTRTHTHRHTRTHTQSHRKFRIRISIHTQYERALGVKAGAETLS